MTAQPSDRRRRLLVLGAGPAQLGLLEAAHRLGYWIAASDRDPAAPGFAFADRRCIVATNDEPGIERLVAALGVGALVAPGSDRPVAVAARVAEKAGLPHSIPASVGLLATNKLRQRAALAAAGVPQPRWCTVVDGTLPLELAYPVIVKAPDRSGRRGLSLVRDASSLPDAVTEAIFASRANVALAEEAVDGPEVVACGFVLDGELHLLAVLDRSCGAAGLLGVPLATTWPSPYRPDVRSVVAEAVAAVGIAKGPVQVVLRIGSAGPRVLSVSARAPGGHDADLISVATGVDLHLLTLRAAFGEQVDTAALSPAPSAPGGVAVRFLVAPEGTLLDVEVPRDLPGIRAVRLHHGPGHAFGPVVRGSDRAGYVLATGGSAAEAAERAEGAAERIRFLRADAEALV